MAKMRKEWHSFLLTDYEKEEEFLRQKHRAGQRFVKVKLPGLYYFEDCAPEDVVYRLDFNPQNAVDRESYRKMYEDYGWTYLQDLNEFSYFRKPAAELEEENQIFSDIESKLAMLKRIFYKRMLPIFVVFLLGFMPAYRLVLDGNWYGIEEIILGVVYTVLFLVYVTVIIHCAVGFRRLEKKYNREK